MKKTLLTITMLLVAGSAFAWESGGFSASRSGASFGSDGRGAVTFGRVKFNKAPNLKDDGGAKINHGKRGFYGAVRFSKPTSGGLGKPDYINTPKGRVNPGSGPSWKNGGKPGDGGVIINPPGDGGKPGDGGTVVTPPTEIPTETPTPRATPRATPTATPTAATTAATATAEPTPTAAAPQADIINTEIGR